jgi:hypothetical protein
MPDLTAALCFSDPALLTIRQNALVSKLDENSPPRAAILCLISFISSGLLKPEMHIILADMLFSGQISIGN